MKTFLWLILLISLSMNTVVYATSPPPFLPPQRFDHPFHGTRHVIYLSPMQLFFKCGQAYACTPIGGERPGHCTTQILRIGSHPLFGGYYVDAAGWKQLWRHETAHCNGWPANHPQ